MFLRLKIYWQVDKEKFIRKINNRNYFFFFDNWGGDIDV